jgi:hypothetical protein
MRPKSSISLEIRPVHPVLVAGSQMDITFVHESLFTKFFEQYSYWGLPSQEYCHAAETFW